MCTFHIHGHTGQSVIDVISIFGSLLHPNVSEGFRSQHISERSSYYVINQKEKQCVLLPLEFFADVKGMGGRRERRMK